MTAAAPAGVPPRSSAAEGAGDEALRGALARHGARGGVMEELLAYSRNEFAAVPAPAPDGFPLADEPFVADWERYSARAEAVGAWGVLREALVQLSFPVEDGTSQRADYQASTRRGAPAPPGEGVTLHDPGSLRLWLHPTPAGRIPVLLLPDRRDFVAVYRALAGRNEPVPVPASMGACIVAGYNNWERVRRLRAHWESEAPHRTEAGWQERFRSMVPRKELYQDRFILLSAGSYSAVPAGQLGLHPDEWARLSVVVRLEHECAHYFTRRVFGRMRNSLHDELIADYAGITAAAGTFHRHWLLRFLGLEDHPRYRAGGRLENYRGDPPLSEDALLVLRRMVAGAAGQLERLHREVAARAVPRHQVLAALTRLSLPELALPDAAATLAQSLPHG